MEKKTPKAKKVHEPLTQECKNKRQALSQIRKLLTDQKISFRTKNQKILDDKINAHDITIVYGPAGSGKTYVTVYNALRTIIDKNNSIDGIVVVKPLMEAADERLGFLPGGIEEKTDPFMMSYWLNMEKIIGKERMNILISAGVIKVIPLAYMRGLTFENKIVILDEAQNALPKQVKMFLTRIGEGSKYIISGDIEQSDRNGNGNGLDDVIDRMADMTAIAIHEFTYKDIVRHKLIREILERYGN